MFWTTRLNHLADGMLLSQECHRLIGHHRIAGRALILGVGTVVLGHLAKVVPERYDLMAQSFWTRRLRPSP